MKIDLDFNQQRSGNTAFSLNDKKSFEIASQQITEEDKSVHNHESKKPKQSDNYMLEEEKDNADSNLSQEDEKMTNKSFKKDLESLFFHDYITKLF